MRPKKMTPAHKTEKFGELVCSNSLRSDMIDVASGALKEEMRLFNSLVLEAAAKTKVEAGSALAVDRESFSARITEIIKNHPLVEVVEAERILLCLHSLLLRFQRLVQTSHFQWGQ